MGTWDELWLNEGFATYFETLGAIAAAPDLAELDGFVPDVTAVGLAADARNESTHALSQIKSAPCKIIYLLAVAAALLGSCSTHLCLLLPTLSVH